MLFSSRALSHDRDTTDDSLMRSVQEEPVSLCYKLTSVILCFVLNHEYCCLIRIAVTANGRELLYCSAKSYSLWYLTSDSGGYLKCGPHQCPNLPLGQFYDW